MALPEPPGRRPPGSGHSVWDRCIRQPHPASVLCVARKDLPPEWLQETVAIPMTELSFFDRMNRIEAGWVPRPEAEVTPTLKQLIPYVVLRSETAGRIGCYRRKGSETRLHGLWSCGVGGHVNPEDATGSLYDLEAILKRGLMRELGEELCGLPADYRPLFRGIINEERTPVGAVHLGLVFTLEVAAPERLSAGKELRALDWISLHRVRERNLELWSVLALCLLEGRTSEVATL